MQVFDIIASQRIHANRMITSTQFAACSRLAGMRSNTATRRAAEMVLVGNCPGIRAAEITGISPQAVSNAIQRIRRAHALALQATAPSQPATAHPQ